MALSVRPAEEEAPKGWPEPGAALAVRPAEEAEPKPAVEELAGAWVVLVASVRPAEAEAPKPAVAERPGVRWSYFGACQVGFGS